MTEDLRVICKTSSLTLWGTDTY